MLKKLIQALFAAGPGEQLTNKTNITTKRPRIPKTQKCSCVFCKCGCAHCRDFAKAGRK